MNLSLALGTVEAEDGRGSKISSPVLFSLLKSSHFVGQAYGRELAEAYEWCQKYRESRREAELHQAWDLYYHVFKRINKQLPSLTTLDLQYVSPALARAEVGVITAADM